MFYDHLVPAQVKEWFTNKFEQQNAGSVSSNDTRVQRLSQAFLEHGTGYNLKVVPETTENPSKSSVQEMHLDLIATILNGPMSTERIFHDGLATGRKRTLSDLGLKNGVATDGSFPFGYFHTAPVSSLANRDNKFITTSILECKDSAAAPDAGHGEGIAEATAAAVEMARVGIPPEHIVVPVFTTTGGLAQIGAVYMLKPSLPSVCFVTPALRLSIEEEAIKAAKIVVAMALHAEQVQNYVEKNKDLTPKPDVTMRCDSDVYHFKLMNDFFSCCGAGKHSQSILRYLHRTNPLAGMSYACLPKAIRLRDDSFCHEDALVFDKLVGYTIGLPADSNDRKALVAEIEAVVQDMHQKGVIHMDLYLSNIMWKKKSNGSFSIRLIDFDAVHTLGEVLTAAAMKQLAEGNVQDFLKLGIQATKEHDTLYIDMLKENIDEDELRCASSTTENEHDLKARLDNSCTILMQPIFEKRFPRSG